MFVHCYAWKIAVEVAIVGIIVWFGLQPCERRDRAEWNGTSSHFILEGRAGSEKYRIHRHLSGKAEIVLCGGSGRNYLNIVTSGNGFRNIFDGRIDQAEACFPPS